MALVLDQIVPWGRCRAEYDLMFNLTASDLSDGVLDCGGGPASFTAEVAATGVRAVAVDPIYGCTSAEMRTRFDATAGPMLDQVRATPDNWTWSYHRDPDDLLANRRATLEKFLADYKDGLCPERYRRAELPSLPFPAGSFGLALCSHLLFLYSELLSEDLHIRAVRELCRVAREVRIFPLLTLQCKPSPYVAAVRNAVASDGWATEIIRVKYELQRGGNQMLRIYRT
jgi:hypothetical protein